MKTLNLGVVTGATFLCVSSEDPSVGDETVFFVAAAEPDEGFDEAEATTAPTFDDVTTAPTLDETAAAPFAKVFLIPAAEKPFVGAVTAAAAAATGALG